MSLIAWRRSIFGFAPEPYELKMMGSLAVPEPVRIIS